MILDANDLANLREKYQDKKIVLGSGVFDLTHVGHISYLQTLKSYGDVVVVLVKPDKRIKQFKHPNRPIIPQDDRAHMVDSIKGVDYVVIGSHGLSEGIDPMYEEVFRLLRPDVYVSSNDTWSKLQDITDAKVHILPREKKGYFESTTSILNHIKKLGSF